MIKKICFSLCVLATSCFALLDFTAVVPFNVNNSVIEMYKPINEKYDFVWGAQMVYPLRNDVDFLLNTNIGIGHDMPVFGRVSSSFVIDKGVKDPMNTSLHIRSFMLNKTWNYKINDLPKISFKVYFL